MHFDKKKIPLLAFLIVTIALLSRLIAATTINVPGTYPTIQEGINAAQPGDTVLVNSGTYTESEIIVNVDGIILKGAGAGKTFINLTSLGGTAVTFDNVTSSTITGFTIRKADVGIISEKSKKINIVNNAFVGNVNAFENRSSFSQVINNTFYGNTRAVFSNSSSTLKNNIIEGSSRYGIAGFRTGSVTYNLFNGNTLGNYSGVSVLPATNATGDPLFVSTASDFHLKTGSPAINAGDPASIFNDVIDGSRNDMGVYGGPAADIIPTTVSGVTATSATDKVTLAWSKNLAYNITGYKVWYGTASGSYTSSVSVGDVNTIDLTTATLTANQKYYFSVRAIDGNSHESLDSTAVSGAIDTLPPSIPGNPAAAIGDGRLYLSWPASTDNESGVKGYRVYYGTSSGSYPNSVDIGNATSYELAGLINNTVYYIAISALDNAGNESAKSIEVNEAPQKIRGIAGLKNSGGCFIATAAYGSYEERHVKLLREFRDRRLLTNSMGSAFVALYYKTSPPIAQFIVDHPWLKPVVRTGLLPVIAFAWLLLNFPLSGLVFTGLAIGCLLFLGNRIRKSETRRSLLMASRSLLLLLVSLTLPAASFGDEQKGVSLGFSYGQLAPSSDEWKEIYSSDQISNFRFSTGYRFSPTVSTEMGVGYLWKNGMGKTLTGKDTGAEVTFQQAPIDLTVLYRLNYIPHQLIVPYIGAGLSYNLYWESVKDGDQIKGGMWGYHATGGMRLLLDRLDPISARDLKKDYGISGTYLLIGATRSVINDFGGQDVDLGGLNYQGGLVFEF